MKTGTEIGPGRCRLDAKLRAAAVAVALTIASTPVAAAPPEPEDEASETGGNDEFGLETWRDDPRAVTALKWRNAGIALILVGTLVGGGALAIGLADPCRPEPGNDCRLSDRRRAALAAGIPAGVVFAGGWTAFGVGQARLRRVRLSFSAGRDGASLFFGGRF